MPVCCINSDAKRPLVFVPTVLGELGEWDDFLTRLDDASQALLVSLGTWGCHFSDIPWDAHGVEMWSLLRRCGTSLSAMHASCVCMTAVDLILQMRYFFAVCFGGQEVHSQDGKCRV